MFVYNLKLDSKNIIKAVFIIISIIITLFFIFSTYRIVSESFRIYDEIPIPDVQILTYNNYANVLKRVHDNLEEYIGTYISFTGYVYRLSDFGENQFVLARDMVISETETFIVGFLCESENISDFEIGTWVEITGEITKGYYHGEIPMIRVVQIKESQIPSEDERYALPPSTAYLPTSALF